MGALVLFFFLATMASTTQSRWVPNLLMPRLGAPGLHASTVVYCNSWRFGVETNNSIDWSVVPETCADYVGKYMKSPQYYADCDFVVDEAIKYVDSLKLAEIDTWVFDIDETAFSNLDYYARPEVGFGSKKRNVVTFYEWVGSAKVPALPSVLRLYKHLIDKKVKIVFLTGSSDAYTKAREDNLKFVGYTTWDKLILRSKDDYDKGLRGAVFKSAKRKELEEKYPKHRIIGNMGDQWSDLIGTNVGNRTFKLPNPMYYV